MESAHYTDIPARYGYLDEENTSSTVASTGAEDPEDSGSDDEEDHTWDPFDRIHDSCFISLVTRVTIELDLSTPFVVERRTHGANNYAVIVSNDTYKFLIKVPLIGTQDRWKPEHTRLMWSEADTTIYIEDHVPQFPVATILEYHADFNNEIGAPYICQTFLEGKSAHDLWFDVPEKNTEEGEGEGEDQDILARAYSPSRACERHRNMFLQSLARTMSKLHCVTEDGAGMLVLKEDTDELALSGMCGYTTASLLDDRPYWSLPVYYTAAEFYLARLNDKMPPDPMDWLKGVRFVFELIMNSSPFAASPDEEESFTLMHPDLGLQNVLVADNGEVTGIIDWEGACFVPRCVGYIALPQDLQLDWLPLAESPSSDELEYLNKYRSVYVEAMLEACGGPESDAKYTAKSGLYNAVHFALFSNFGPSFWDRVEIFVDKLLHAIPELADVDHEGFIEGVGSGSLEYREILDSSIPKLFDYRTS